MEDKRIFMEVWLQCTCVNLIFCQSLNESKQKILSSTNYRDGRHFSTRNFIFQSHQHICLLLCKGPYRSHVSTPSKSDGCNAVWCGTLPIRPVYGSVYPCSAKECPMCTLDTAFYCSVNVIVKCLWQIFYKYIESKIKIMNKGCSRSGSTSFAAAVFFIYKISVELKNVVLIIFWALPSRWKLRCKKKVFQKSADYSGVRVIGS